MSDLIVSLPDASVVSGSPAWIVPTIKGSVRTIASRTLQRLVAPRHGFDEVDGLASTTRGVSVLINVEPRGFESLTSAVQRRLEGFAVVRSCSENRLCRPQYPRPCSPLFATTCGGNCQIPVKLASTAWVLPSVERATLECMRASPGSPWSVSSRDPDTFASVALQDRLIRFDTEAGTLRYGDSVALIVGA